MASAYPDPQLIEKKIRTCLRIYPKLSPSMLQIGIGSSLPTQLWHPILESMVTTGEVKRDTVIDLSAQGRSWSFTVLSLNPDFKVAA